MSNPFSEFWCLDTDSGLRHTPTMGKKKRTPAPVARTGFAKEPGEHFVRKQIFLAPDEVEALRAAAFEDRCTQSDVVRRAIRKYLGL